MSNFEYPSTHSPVNGWISQGERLKPFNLSDEEIELLREFAPIIEENAGQISDAYVAQLERSSFKRDFSSVRASVANNFRQMFGGRFDENALANGGALGRSFAELGVSQEAIFHAASVYCERVLPLILLHAQCSPKRLTEIVVAFQKVALWDQAMIMNAYNDYAYVAPVREVSWDLKNLIGRIAENSRQIQGSLTEMYEPKHMTRQGALV